MSLKNTPLVFLVLAFSLGLGGALGLTRVSRTQAASAAASAPNRFLDPGFGEAGRALVPITGTNQIARDVALQADGKLLLAGYDKWNTSTEDVILTRFNPDGSLDAAFGNGGVVITSFSAGNDTAYAVTVQPDGKIVAAGVTTYGSKTAAALMRYNADGSLDTAFGSGGIVTASLSANAWFLSVIVLDDGRILAGGSVNSSPRAFLLARFTSNGTPDTTLGGAGVVTTTISGVDANAWDMAMQPDGKIILAGYVRTSSSETDFAVARYNADGSLDTAFGSGGIVVQSLEMQDYAYGVNVQSSGKIVVGGFAAGKGALARYNADGSPDTAFGPVAGQNYFTLLVPGYTSVSFIETALQGNDSIVAAANLGGGPPLVGVAVFSPDGIPNGLFGASGVMTASNGAHLASSYALLTQPDGGVVLAGHVDRDDSANYEYDLALWRFIPRGSLYLPLVIR